MLRFERGFLAAARAETGVEPRAEGERSRPFVVADRVGWGLGDPLTVVSLELGVPGFRGVADMVVV